METLKITISRATYDALGPLAEAEMRSIPQQVAWMLTQAVAECQRPTLPGLEVK